MILTISMLLIVANSIKGVLWKQFLESISAPIFAKSVTAQASPSTAKK